MSRVCRSRSPAVSQDAHRSVSFTGGGVTTRRLLITTGRAASRTRSPITARPTVRLIRGSDTAMVCVNVTEVNDTPTAITDDERGDVSAFGSEFVSYSGIECASETK